MINSWRELGWAIAALLLAVLLAYFLVLLTPHEATGETRERLPVPTKYEDRLIELEREAVEEGYKKHVMLLFENWVKDPAKQPGRALTGIDVARRAYIDSMEGIEERAKARAR